MTEAVTVRKLPEGMREKLDAALRAIQVPQRIRLAPVTSYAPETRTVRVMWGVGAQVLRWDWDTWDYFSEELQMDDQACDLSRLNGGAPVLDTHQRGGLENVIGVVERAWIEKGQGYADIRLSSRAELEWLRQDVADGVIRNVSIGYEVRAMEQVGYDPENGYPQMRVTDWQPFEISLVPVGADAEAGTRSKPDSATTTQCVVRMFQPPAAPAAQPQENRMDAVKDPAAGNQPAVDVKIIQDQAREQETARVRDISAVGEEWDEREKAREAIAAGTTADKFREYVMGRIREKNAQKVNATRDIGLTDAEVKRYSINRMISALLNEGAGQRDAWKGAGFERECHEAVMKKRGIEPQNQGIFVPWDVQSRQLVPRNVRELAARDPWALERLMRDLQSRDLTVATANAGGYLVATDNLAGSFIEMLRAEMVMMELGVTTLDGLVGQVTIPKQTAASTMYYPANEGTAITESQPTLGQLSLTAKHAGIYVELSRALLLQSNPAADALTIADIQKQIGIGVDTGIYAGSGAPQPTGLAGTGGIGSVTGTSLAYAGIVEFQTDVGTANGLDRSCAYLTTPAVAGLLMQRQRFSSTDSPLWTGTVQRGTMAGYTARASSLVTAATMAFGAWRQIILAMWGDLEIARSEYANFPAGITGIRGFISYDVGVRQAGAFSYASSIT